MSPRPPGQAVEGEGDEGFRLAGARGAQDKHVRQKVVPGNPQLLAGLHGIAQKEAAPGLPGRPLRRQVGIVAALPGPWRAHGKYVKAARTLPYEEKQAGGQREKGKEGRLPERGKAEKEDGAAAAVPACQAKKRS